MSNPNPPTALSAQSAPTNATQTKERLYAQLAASLGRTSRAISKTADLCEQLQTDLHAMRIFAGLDAAKFMTVAAQLNADDEEDGQAVEAKGKGEGDEADQSVASPQDSKTTKDKGKEKDKDSKN